MIYPWHRQTGFPTPADQLDPIDPPRLVHTSTPAAVATAAELAADLKVTTTDEAGLLDRLIGAATSWCEAWTGRSFMTRTIDLWYDAIPAGAQAITLPGGPVSEVTAVTTWDEDDVSSDMDATDYQVDLVSMPARVALRAGVSWPTGLRQINALRIQYAAGYSAESLPPALKAAVLNLAAETYLLRGKQVDARDITRAVQPTSDTLLMLEPFKVVR